MRRHLLALALAVGALAGCSSEPAVFDDEAGAEVTCLVHQEGEPGAAYVDQEQRDTGKVLAMMRYYTAHGSKPFCDGAPAGDSDRAWAQVYVDLGGDAGKVSSALG